MAPPNKGELIATFIHNAINPILANRFQHDENKTILFHNTLLRTPKDVVIRVKLQVLEHRLRVLLEDERHDVTKVVISLTANRTSKVVERWVFTLGENLLPETNEPIKLKLYDGKCQRLLKQLSEVIDALPQLKGRFTTDFFFHTSMTVSHGLDRPVRNKAVIVLPNITIGNTTVALYVEYRKDPFYTPIPK